MTCLHSARQFKRVTVLHSTDCSVLSILFSKGTVPIGPLVYPVVLLESFHVPYVPFLFPITLHAHSQNQLINIHYLLLLNGLYNGSSYSILNSIYSL